MNENLLANIFYGYEISDKGVALRWLKSMFSGSLSDAVFDRIYTSVHEFFSRRYEGVFGGQITAGDGLFMAAYMEMLRPTRMVEIGVASGYSSSFILSHAERMGILGSEPFLSSFDLVERTAAGNATGSLLREIYPHFERHWNLLCNITSADLIAMPGGGLEIRPTDRILAFVDGSHNHPWPLMDLAYLRKVLPYGSWVVMQDSQMMERWIADCVRFELPSPAPVRGVNLAVSLWPGTKIIGHDLCYNCAAVRLDVSDDRFLAFARDALQYPFEIEFPQPQRILK